MWPQDARGPTQDSSHQPNSPALPVKGIRSYGSIFFLSLPWLPGSSEGSWVVKYSSSHPTFFT